MNKRHSLLKNVIQNIPHMIDGMEAQSRPSKDKSHTKKEDFVTNELVCGIHHMSNY